MRLFRFEAKTEFQALDQEDALRTLAIQFLLLADDIADKGERDDFWFKIDTALTEITPVSKKQIEE